MINKRNNSVEAEKRLLKQADKPYGTVNKAVAVQRTNIGLPVDMHAMIRTHALNSRGKYTMNSIIVEALELWLMQNEIKPEVITRG